MSSAVTQHSSATAANASSQAATRQLREAVYEANIALARAGLAMDTFGNASGILRASNLVAIKPSGVPYDKLRPEHMVLVTLEGKVVEGKLRPSTDLPTHLALYRAFPTIGGVAHTHSHYATVFAQAGREIPCFGTTHADYFYGPVPVTDPLVASTIQNEYELNTGREIIRRFEVLNPQAMPAVLVQGHAPFCWGPSPGEAAHNAWMLEESARMAFHTLQLNPAVRPIRKELLDKHFLRKHGAGRYYGQG
jgi:L-ribulose-5-phosphate 4-epimerase